MRWLATGRREPPEREQAVPLPAAPQPQAGLVARPDQLNEVVALLTGRGGSAGGSAAVALTGPGGFGKTTLAGMVRRDPRIVRHFPGGALWLTLGHGVHGAALATKINDLMRHLGEDHSDQVDPQRAGRRLGGLLESRRERLLLIVDDLWTAEQFEPLRLDGSRCGMLVTTRVPEAIPALSTKVSVAALAPAQARQMLASGVPGLPSASVDELVRACGQWPLLLTLVAARLRVAKAVGGDISAAIQRTVDQKAHGQGEAATPLNMALSADRTRALAANIQLSVEMLPAGGSERVAELGVFAGDTAVPVTVIAHLWAATGRLSSADTAAMCQQMGQLALVREHLDTGTIEVHDVIRANLRSTLGQWLPRVHAALLDQIATSLPTDRSFQDPAAPAVAWWELGNNESYLWNHLAHHVAEAQRPGEFDASIADLRWLSARLRRGGPAAIAVDLAAGHTSRAAALGRSLARAAHLLAPTEPRHSLIDVWISRVRDEPLLQNEADRWQRSRTGTRLAGKWRLPDLPEEAVRWILAGHTGEVNSVAFAPDGTWLASASDDRSVRVWNVAAGTALAVLTGHTDRVLAVAIARDGRWMATAGADRTVRIWDTATATVRATMTGHTHDVRSVAIAPDGTWLATASTDRTVRIWDAATATPRATLGHKGGVWSVAISPDGRRLATGSADSTVGIWDVATWTATASLTGHTDWVRSVAFGPDGSWLASCSDDATARIWDLTTATVRHVLTGHKSGVWSVATSPDGRWLATASADQTTRIWDVATATVRATLTGHTGAVRSVAIAPDGRWLTTSGSDRTVRLCDAGAPAVRSAAVSQAGPVRSVAVAPGGRWLATAGPDNILRVWDTATGEVRTSMAGHTGRLRTVTIAPDGRWIATGSTDQTVRIWDTASARARVTLTGHTGEIRSVAISPDGLWLATAGADHTVYVWDATTGAARIVIASHTGEVLAIAISPDGQWMATASTDHSVRILDAATGAQKVALTGHTGEVRSLAISPDGRWMATAGADNTLRLWYTANGALRATLAGHADWVRSVAVSPDGRRLATASGDHTVRVWDPNTGACVAMMRVDSSLHCCAWTSDSRGIALAGDKGVYLFDFHDDADHAGSGPTPP